MLVIMNTAGLMGSEWLSLDTEGRDARPAVDGKGLHVDVIA